MPPEFTLIVIIQDFFDYSFNNLYYIFYMLSAREEKILKSIKVPSESYPFKPDFPPDNPKFPATPTFKIDVPGFSNVWLKDESVNHTGTHKDRMAWEIVKTYRNFLISKKKGLLSGPLPELSLISSGSAAVAVQTMLKKYGLPKLRVLVDTNLNKKMLNYLKKIGCKIFRINLGKKLFNWKEVLFLTKKP
ncbi:MAG: pyridoxal-phosphate dependent enzyme [archaeon]